MSGGDGFLLFVVVDVVVAVVLLVVFVVLEAVSISPSEAATPT